MIVLVMMRKHHQTNKQEKSFTLLAHLKLYLNAERQYFSNHKSNRKLRMDYFPEEL